MLRGAIRHCFRIDAIQVAIECREACAPEPFLVRFVQPETAHNQSGDSRHSRYAMCIAAFSEGSLDGTRIQAKWEGIFPVFAWGPDKGIFPVFMSLPAD
jgi:hypothetical protein